MEPSAAEKLVNDLSKLILMNPGCRGCHLTKQLEVEGGEEDLVE